MYRTHYCGTLSQADEGNEVTLAGWVDVRRDLGGVIFIELRDHTGKVQIVADPTVNSEVHGTFESLRSEYCVQATGKIQNRPDGTENPDLRTGAVEMYPDSIIVLSKAEPLPLPLKDFPEADENFRLKHRYLDLRGEHMQQNIRMRHQIIQAIREYLVEEDFLEIDTPTLTLSTPEGARDYLVPSRVQEGKFYALPQSPQLFKQILMSSGFEKYFQIAKCFRDEDLRADRQPEFSQVDLEMAFTTEDQIIDVTEKMIRKVFEVLDRRVDIPFERMDYDEAISRFGSDKPDLRFGVELIDYTELMAVSGFESFAKIAKSGGAVKAICVPTKGWSRKDYDDLRNMVMGPDYGAKGLAWITFEEDGKPNSPIAKFFSEDELKQIHQLAGSGENQSVFFIADRPSLVHEVLGRLRLYLGEKLNLIDKAQDRFVWIVNWPIFHQDDQTGALSALHHPFTAPAKESDLNSQETLATAKAKAYDIVYNGVELGGGSIRIHDEELQHKVLKALGITPEEAERRFGFFLRALSYGAPPHGGIALGLDRFVMLLTGSNSIRQVIPFPKIQSATCPLTSAPSEIAEEQLAELSLRLRVKKKED